MTTALSSMITLCNQTAARSARAAVGGECLNVATNHSRYGLTSRISPRNRSGRRGIFTAIPSSGVGGNAVFPVSTTTHTLGQIRGRCSTLDPFYFDSVPGDVTCEPVPMPQLALDRIYDDEPDDFIVLREKRGRNCDDSYAISESPPATYSSTRHNLNEVNCSMGRNKPSNTAATSHVQNPGKKSYSNLTTKGKSGGGAGGGTGGRYRCPKCGSYVSFRHEEFEENTFYCATCSGWFLVTPNAGNSEEGGATNETIYPNSIAKMVADPTASKNGDVTDRQLLTMSFLPNEGKESEENGASSRREQNERDSIGKNAIVDDNTSREGKTVQEDAAQQTGNPVGRRSRIKLKRDMPTPVEICKGLDEYVIGQPNVKMALSVGVYNHYKRIDMAERNAARAAAKKAAAAAAAAMSAEDELDGVSVDVDSVPNLMNDVRNENEKFASSLNNGTRGSNVDSVLKGYCEASVSSVKGSSANETEDCELDKSNIIIIGPTGSGKTLLVKTLARLIDVPIVIADATCLTQAGYVGEDVESILLKLYHEAGQDLERCQKGIVYLDEADKIRKSGGNVSISRDVSGEGVQHALLKIVEGNVINVPKEPGRKNPRGDFLSIDTTNILFICGGAFSGLERIINRRMDAASIGFGAQMKKELDDHTVQGTYFDEAIPKDLVDYGMIPEFVGRFPVIESTKGLDVQNLIDILTVPKNSLIKQYRALFSKDGVDFHVTDCALEQIAKIAHTRGSGARGLRSITENILMETMFVVPSIPDCHTVYVDAESVKGESKPVLLKHADMTVEKYEGLKNQGLHGEADGAEHVYVDQTDRDNDGFGQAAA